jgi:hypothetical protein
MLNSKRKKIIVVFIIFIVLCLSAPLIIKQYNQNILDASNYPIYSKHEDMSKARYETMQRMLDSCAAQKDTSGIRFLSRQLDAQLKLEDFFIRFREAEHIKFTLFGSVCVTFIVSIFTSVLTLIIARKSGWKK